MFLVKSYDGLGVLFCQTQSTSFKLEWVLGQIITTRGNSELICKILKEIICKL
jgi:hypothetical protein